MAPPSRAHHGAVRHQAGRRARRRHRGAGPARSSARSALLDLSALGLGAIIGTGIFVILGEAIGDAGPAIILSFVLAGVTCAFSALSLRRAGLDHPGRRQRLHVLLRDDGRADRLDHRLGPDPRVRRVRRRRGGRLGRLPQRAARLGRSASRCPTSISQPPGEGGVVNLPAAFLVLAVAALLIVGFRESARANTVMVVIKLAHPGRCSSCSASPRSTRTTCTPFAPEGTGGVVTAASLIFFAYIGFDAISTSGEETKNPQRDLPIAILGSLAVATILYILVALAATGALPYTELDGSEAPLADALSEGAGFGWARDRASRSARWSRSPRSCSPSSTARRGSCSRCRATGWCRKRLRVREPEDAHADLHDGLLRRLHRRARRGRAARGDREAGQHRHAVRVPAGEHRRDGAAPHAARPAARLPRPVRATSARRSGSCSAST